MSATPWPAGPWRAVVNKDRSINIISARNDEGESEKIALINGRDKDAARLIQHAPEMAEALECLANMARFFPATPTYGTRPRTGHIYIVADGAGEAAITVEDLRRAAALLSRIRGETP